MFRAYGGVCAVFLVLFVLVNFYSRNEGGMNANLPDDIDPKSVRSILAISTDLSALSVHTYTICTV